jgi:hypothetical protein
VHHLHTFGCIAYAKNTKPHLSKLEDKGHKMIFVGYEKGTKAYGVYDPLRQRVHIIRDVVFDEAAQWDWGKGDGAETTRSGNFSIEYMVYSTGTPMEQDGADVEQWQLELPAEAPEQLEPVADAQEGMVDEAEQFDIESEIQLDVDHDDAPLRLRSIGSIVGQAPVPGLAIRNLQEHLHTISADEPATLEEALHDFCWNGAMRKS